MEVAMGPRHVRINCVCGQDYTYPDVVNTGTEPSEKAAERSRSKAFRAAGVVKNVGGFALGISLLGILFFPIALLGAGVGIYVLTMVRGPLGRYSGRRAAVAAVVVGAGVFLGEGSFAMNWLKMRRLQRMFTMQASASEDLRALLRAQRLFRATHDTYGSFKEFRFKPPAGLYTFYLAPDDMIEAEREGEFFVDPLPEGSTAAVSESRFTAIAVANLDADPFLDVWKLTDQGSIVHLLDDTTDMKVSEGDHEVEQEAVDEGDIEEAGAVDAGGEKAGEKEAEVTLEPSTLPPDSVPVPPAREARSVVQPRKSPTASWEEDPGGKQ
jgi:hypothetical protein